MFALAAAAWQGLQDEQEGGEPFFSVTGAGPTNSTQRQQMELSGQWAPNTVKIGSFRLVYTDMPFINLALGGIGTLMDQLRFDKKLDEKDAVERAELWGLAMSNAFLEKRMLSGLSGLLKVVQNPDERGIMQLKRIVGGVAGGFTNPSLLRWARNTFMATEQDGTVPRLDQTSTAGWLSSMLPFSVGYNTPALNVLGEPISDSPWAPSTKRVFAVLPAEHPILGPLVKAGLFLSAPSKLSKVKVEGEDIPVGRSGDVWRRFVEVRGETLRGMLSPEVVAAISAMPDREHAQKRLHDIAATAQTVARYKLTAEIRDGKLAF
jgi:hypothetical protein